MNSYLMVSFSLMSRNLVLLADKVLCAIFPPNQSTVYSLSTYLSILVSNHSQLGSSLPRLVFEIWPEFLATPPKSSSNPISSSPSNAKSNSNSKSEVVSPISTSESLKETYQSDLKLLLQSSSPFNTDFESNEEHHQHLLSLLLLSTSCLPSKSGVLGSSTNINPNNQSVANGGERVEYWKLRRQVEETVSRVSSSLGTLDKDEFKKKGSVLTEGTHLKLADLVYRSISENDGFLMSKLLSQDFEVTVFQRTLISQKLKSFREKIWGVLRKGYIGLPLPLPNSNPSKGKMKEDWLLQALTLSISSIPILPTEEIWFQAYSSKLKRKVKSGEVPDEWDVSKGLDFQSLSLGDDEILSNSEEGDTKEFLIGIKRFGEFLEGVEEPTSTSTTTSQDTRNALGELSLMRFKNDLIPPKWRGKVLITEDGKNWSLKLR